MLALGPQDRANGQSSAVFASRLSDIITAVTSYCTVPPTILLLGLFADTRMGPEPWSNYIAAQRALAAANPTQVGFIDLTRTMPPTSDAVHNLYSGTYLPNDKGSSFIADRVLSALT